jgi:hypothetical protein
VSGWSRSRNGVQVRALARFAALRPADGDRARVLGEFAADEVAPALVWTRTTAAARLAHAVDLVGRHPAALEALDAGVLDLCRSRVPVGDEPREAAIRG